MPLPHPAYPSRADLRREAAVNNAYNAAMVANLSVRDALRGALTVLNLIDRDQHCMAPGYHFDDIREALAEMMPRVDDDSRIAALNEWARDRVEDAVS